MVLPPSAPHRLMMISAGLDEPGCPSHKGPLPKPSAEMMLFISPICGWKIHSQRKAAATTGVTDGRKYNVRNATLPAIC